MCVGGALSLRHKVRQPRAHRSYIHFWCVSLLSKTPSHRCNKRFTVTCLSGCCGQSTYACWCQHERIVRHLRLDHELRVFLVWSNMPLQVWPLVIHLTGSTMPRAPTETKGTLCLVVIYGEHTGRTPPLGIRLSLYPDLNSNSSTKHESPWLPVTPINWHLGFYPAVLTPQQDGIHLWCSVINT